MNKPGIPHSKIDLGSLDVALTSIEDHLLRDSTSRKSAYDFINSTISNCAEINVSLLARRDSSGQIRVLSDVGWDRLSEKSRVFVINAIEKSLDADQPNSIQQTKNKEIFCARTNAQESELIYLILRDRAPKGLERQVMSDLADEIASQLETFEKLMLARQNQKSREEILKITQLVRNLGASSSTKELAYHLVNDLQNIISASRVSFLNARGKLMAISSVAEFSKNNQLTRSLRAIGSTALKRKSEFEWPNSKTVPGSKTSRVEEYFAALDSKYAIASPLMADRLIGAIIIESQEELEEIKRAELNELCRETLSFCLPTMGRMERIHSIPGIRLLDFLFNAVLIRPLRSLICFLLLLGMFSVLGYWLFAVTRPFEIYAQGELHPVTKRQVFAPESGEVAEVFVAEGSQVQSDDQLVTIESQELDQKLLELEGDIAEANQKLTSLSLVDLDNKENQTVERIAQITSEIELTKLRIESLKKQQLSFRKKRDSLKVYSPITGSVTTPKIGQRLNSRPINRGDLLLTVADLAGPWEVILRIPDNRVSYILNFADENDSSVQARVRLVTQPDESFTAELNKMDYRADFLRQENSEINYVKGTFSIDQQQLGDSLRIGTRVHAHIDCGERSNFFLLTYELTDKIREWFFY